MNGRTGPVLTPHHGEGLLLHLVVCLQESTVSIQIVTGDQDKLPGVNYSRRLARVSKSAQLHIFENCGHYVPMMQPSKLNRLIADTIAVASGQ